MSMISCSGACGDAKRVVERQLDRKTMELISLRQEVGKLLEVNRNLVNEAAAIEENRAANDAKIQELMARPPETDVENIQVTEMRGKILKSERNLGDYEKHLREVVLELGAWVEHYREDHATFVTRMEQKIARVQASELDNIAGQEETLGVDRQRQTHRQQPRQSQVHVLELGDLWLIAVFSGFAAGHYHGGQAAEMGVGMKSQVNSCQVLFVCLV